MANDYRLKLRGATFLDNDFKSFVLPIPSLYEDDSEDPYGEHCQRVYDAYEERTSPSQREIDIRNSLSTIESNKILNNGNVKLNKVLQLDAAGSQFRLIYNVRIFNGTIHCDFFRATFMNKVHYDALSYRWENPQDSNGLPLRQTIMINGVSFNVRPNVYQFLYRMIKAAQKGPVFIDAICIDQNDNDEKSRQVALMGDIYKNADQVIVWLGELPEMAFGTMDIMRRIYTHEYWTRLWIVQEVILGCNVIIALGIFSCPFAALGDRLPGTVSINTEPVTKLLLEKDKWDRGEYPGGMRFHQALQTFRGQHATEPRDMIYGVCGICDIRLRAEYWGPTEDVFRDVLVAATQQSQISNFEDRVRYFEMLKGLLLPILKLQMMDYGRKTPTRVWRAYYEAQHGVSLISLAEAAKLASYLPNDDY
ncbi:Heterokaryon incompatibility protein [Hyphodiscus hymeniophilus]|uniref:Heterokaryon incompatibility protein n=1 Tax=Hyphodiscus hymeniophilus TaxID=353542 RepID=A0A9P6VEJ8_9HELO|nr:Heterokaryon incompatibility protein [Hyphodiscus hymeniophilus]